MMIVRECAFVHTPTTHLTELGLVTKNAIFHLQLINKFLIKDTKSIDS